MALPPGMINYEFEIAPGQRAWQIRPDPNYATPAPPYVREDPQVLAQRTNEFMTGQAVAPFIANLPNYQNLTTQRSNVIGDQMRGSVPMDVRNQLMQVAAERGIATGMSGSDNSNAAMLRSLGLTSLGLQQQGMQNFTQAIADTPTPELFNPASLYVPERAAYQEFQAAEGRNPFAGAPGAPAPEPEDKSNLWGAQGLAEFMERFRRPTATYGGHVIYG